MRIASAEAIGFTFDHDREPLSYCLIRVVTDNGIVGWGEACDSFGLALMIDGNENFTVDTALAVAEGLADLGIGWFEEPVLQESPPAMDAVAARSPVPIACGEHMYGLAEFEEAIRRNRASVLQPDAATCGGIAEGMRIAAAGRRAGGRVVPHTASGPVALAANLHLAAAAPSIDLLEYPYPLAECWATIAPGCPLVPDQVVDGALRPPDEPGFGVEIDYEAVRSRPYQPPAARTGPSPRYAGNV